MQICALSSSSSSSGKMFLDGTWGLGLSVWPPWEKSAWHQGAVGRGNVEVLPHGIFSKPLEHHESHLVHKCFGLCCGPSLSPAWLHYSLSEQAAISEKVMDVGMMSINGSWGWQWEGIQLKCLSSCLKKPSQPSVKGQLSLNLRDMVGVGESFQRVTSQWPRPSQAQGVHESPLLPWAVFSLAARAGFQLETPSRQTGCLWSPGRSGESCQGVCWLCLQVTLLYHEESWLPGQCSVTLTVTLEKDCMAAPGQLQHSQLWQFHCRLCAIAEPVWHPFLLACVKEAGVWFPAVLCRVTRVSMPWGKLNLLLKQHSLCQEVLWCHQWK